MFSTTSFAGFNLEEQVDETANSLLYRIKPQERAPKTILKLLKTTASSEIEKIHFHQELVIAKKINSPFIAKVFNLVTEGDAIALLVEDIDAKSLSYWLNKEPPTLVQGLQIALSICQGLRDIHNAKIIHKDINSQNIIWNRTTQEVKIIDFGIACTFSRETISPLVANKLEGNLSYMSPEQTGRMNRPIDSRTDFYSLGVTLYELFTGKLPFTSSDPLELIHSHIAKTPIPPEQINPKIPPALGMIILKLLEKSADARYQTAYGIEYDLRQVLHQYETLGSVPVFKLASKDLNSQFIISSKLYGRESDLMKLEGSFKKVCQGNMVLSLIKGYSGVGKTSLVQELYRPLAIAKGRYITGKFDQYQKNVPYLALANAFNGFFDQILAESTEKLIVWKETILHAIKEKGQVLIEVIPHLSKIIGPQPAVPAVDPQSAKNRFNETFLDLVNVLCSPQEPLVLFLDDLQWTDRASFDLLKLMLTHMRIEGLHIVGAYRDNEVDESHPLMLMLDEITKAGQTYDVITLGNLTQEDITNLVAETLSLTQEEVGPLVFVIYKKTSGNAFYATEFFKNLHASGHLKYTQDKWQWDLTEEIESQNMPSNVVDFMVGIIKLFIPELQNALRMAACIGNTFDLNILSICLYSEIYLPKTLDRIYPAIESEIIVPTNDEYKKVGITNVYGEKVTFRFKHDRIQQAAYSLINDKDRPNIHHRIGNLLLEYAEKSRTTEQRLFEIVGHLNKAIPVITDKAERLQLIELNYRAGIKARLASAYQAASEYFTEAKNLLPEDYFTQRYELTFNLYLQLAESLYINGRFTEANAIYPLLITNSNSTMDTVKVKIVQMEDYHLQGDYEKAILHQKQGLALLDLPFPPDNKIEAAIVKALQQTPKLLSNRDVSTLLNAKDITSLETLAKLRILAGMWMSAYLVSKDDIVQWCSIIMTNLTLEYGNSEFASFAYVQYGYICVIRLRKFKDSHKFGALGVELADRYSNIEMRGKVYFNFAIFVNHWTQHIRTSTELFRKSYLLSVEGGDWTYAVYSAANILSNLLIEGKPCHEIEQEGQKYYEFLKDKAEIGLNSFFLPGGYVPLQNLLGKTKSRDSFDCDYLNEKTLLSTLGKLPIVEGWFYSAKIRSLFLFRILDKALAVVGKADIVAEGVPSQIKIPEAYFYSCLIITATLNGVKSKADQKKYLDYFEKYKSALQFWAKECPDNFLHKFQLICAEECRINGRDLKETLALYDLAFEEAKKVGYLNNAALVQELKGRFWLEQNQAVYGLTHLKEAYKLYQAWGALGKIAQLSEEFPSIGLIPSIVEIPSLEGTPSTTLTSYPTVTTGTMNELQIDYESIYKLASSLSQTLVWNVLINNFLTIVMENMGANRAALFIKENSDWIMDTEGWIETKSGNVVLESKKKLLDKLSDYPQSIINATIHSKEIINVDSNKIPLPFCKEPYFKNKPELSIICAPIMSHNQIFGVIYLENNLASSVFGEKHNEILNIFLTQVAISIDNAQLFAKANKAPEERNNSIQQLKESNQELDDFTYIASHDLRSPLKNISALAQAIAEECKDILPEHSEKDLAALRNQIQQLDTMLEKLRKSAGAGHDNKAAKKVVRHHGGNIRVQNNKNKRGPHLH